MAVNSFAAINTNTFTRKWGTTDGNVVEPYISGYFFTKFTVPAALPDYVNHAQATGVLQLRDICTALDGAALACTIPGGTLNKTEFQGLGGIRWAVPTNVDFDTNFSMRFLEFSGLPIHSIFHGWVRMIRDYRMGISPMASGVGGAPAATEYSKATYSGSLLYYTTRPNTNEVEYSALLTGVFPMKDPTDSFSSDLAGIDKVEIDMDFNVDYIWHEKWVVELAKKDLTARKNQLSYANASLVADKYGV